MSTRCQVSFNDGGQRCALIYKHHDGYPDTQHGMFQTIQGFFEEVEKQTSDTRFGDAEYLAAKFVVYLMENKLDNLGCGVSMDLHDDIEFLYNVDCGDFTNEVRPLVSYDDENGNTIQSPFNKKDKSLVVTFEYPSKNAIVTSRRVKLQKMDNEYLEGIDLDKNDYRKFSMKNVDNLKFE